MPCNVSEATRQLVKDLSFKDYLLHRHTQHREKDTYQPGFCGETAFVPFVHQIDTDAHPFDVSSGAGGPSPAPGSQAAKPKGSGTGGPGPVPGSKAKAPTTQRAARMGGSPAPLSK